MNLFSESLKFVLPKSFHACSASTDQDVQKIGSFFTSLKEKITKLETTHYKTAMMLFFDMMKKLENDIFPSQIEINDANLKATEAFNFVSENDLEEN